MTASHPTAQAVAFSPVILQKKARWFLRRSRRVSDLWIEQEVDDECVEPDDRALALAVFLEEDDAQLGEPTESLVDVLHVPINNPCGLVDGMVLPGG